MFLGYVILTIATLILSQAGNVIRFAETHPISVAFFRLLFASLILIPFTLPILKKNLKLLTLKNVLRLTLMGIFFALHFFFWIKAVQITKVAHAAICFALNPAFIAIGAVVFLKEKISRGTILGILLGFIGIAAIGLGDFSFEGLNNQDFLGDALSVLAALVFAIYFLLGKSLRSNIDNRVVMSFVYTVGSLFSFILISFMDLPLGNFNQTTWLALLTLAIFQTILGHASIIYVLKFFKASFVSTFLLLEPLLAGLVAFFLFAEKISSAAWVGYLFISLGIVLLFEDDIKKTLLTKKHKPQNDIKDLL